MSERGIPENECSSISNTWPACMHAGVRGRRPGLVPCKRLNPSKITLPPKPSTTLATDIVNRAQEAGLVVLTCGIHANVIHFLMPLTVSDEIPEERLKLFAASVSDVVSREQAQPQFKAASG